VRVVGGGEVGGGFWVRKFLGEVAKRVVLGGLIFVRGRGSWVEFVGKVEGTRKWGGVCLVKDRASPEWNDEAIEIHHPFAALWAIFFFFVCRVLECEEEMLARGISRTTAKALRRPLCAVLEEGFGKIHLDLSEPTSPEARRKEYMKRYRSNYNQANKQKIQQYNKQYHLDNLQKKKSYYLDNVQKFREYNKVYRTENWHKKKMYHQKNQDKIKLYWRQRRGNTFHHLVLSSCPFVILLSSAPLLLSSSPPSSSYPTILMLLYHPSVSIL
jgi:hypothetical protein